MEINDEQIEKLADAVGKAVRMNNGSSCEFCQNEERRIRHRTDHEFVQSLIRLADKMERAKWGIGTSIIKALLIAAILGGLAFAWKYGVKSGTPPMP